MTWNKRPKTERPDFPKPLAVGGSPEQVRDLLSMIHQSDPDATVLFGGAHGVYVKVHNEAAEITAKPFAEHRSFPLR